MNSPYFQQCETLLKPTSTGHVLDAYAEKRVRPSHGQIFDHFINASKRKGNIAWADDGMGGADELVHTFAEAQQHWTRSVSTADYIDVHCWRFTPASFRMLISDLQSLGLINLEIKAEFDTTGCEFYVSLSKKVGPPEKLDRFAALQTRKRENA